MDSCQEKLNPEDEIGQDICSEEEAKQKDIEYRTKDVVRKYQFVYDQSTCLVAKFPEAIPQTIAKDVVLLQEKEKYQQIY